MVFQDPYGALNPWITARQAVAEVFQVWHSLGRREAGTRADQRAAGGGADLRMRSSAAPAS